MGGFIFHTSVLTWATLSAGQNGPDPPNVLNAVHLEAEGDLPIPSNTLPVPNEMDLEKDPLSTVTSAGAPDLGSFAPGNALDLVSLSGHEGETTSQSTASIVDFHSRRLTITLVRRSYGRRPSIATRARHPRVFALAGSRSIFARADLSY